MKKVGIVETSTLSILMRKIGIVGTSSNNSFGVSNKYMTFARQFGGVIILTPDMDFQEDIDLLILQGGADVDPARYGQVPEYGLSRSNPYLEYFDRKILPEYIKRRTPIFGICRGLQTLNVALGGTLRQNIQGHPTSNYREETVHDVKIKNSVFSVVKVNSLHHQSIGKLGGGLSSIGEYAGVVEAIKHKTLPICAVQWHPEEIWDEFSIELIESIIKGV